MKNQSLTRNLTLLNCSFSPCLLLIVPSRRVNNSSCFFSLKCSPRFCAPQLDHHVYPTFNRANALVVRSSFEAFVQLSSQQFGAQFFIFSKQFCPSVSAALRLARTTLGLNTTGSLQNAVDLSLNSSSPSLFADLAHCLEGLKSFDLVTPRSLT